MLTLHRALPFLFQRSCKMYQLHPEFMGKPTCVQRLADNAFIPFDSANTDYQTYLEWIAEGNQPLPAEETE